MILSYLMTTSIVIWEMGPRDQRELARANDADAAEIIAATTDAVGQIDNWTEERARGARVRVDCDGTLTDDEARVVCACQAMIDYTLARSASGTGLVLGQEIVIDTDAADRARVTVVWRDADGVAHPQPLWVEGIDALLTVGDWLDAGLIYGEDGDGHDMSLASAMALEAEYAAEEAHPCEASATLRVRAAGGSLALNATAPIRAVGADVGDWVDVTIRRV